MYWKDQPTENELCWRWHLTETNEFGQRQCVNFYYLGGRFSCDNLRWYFLVFFWFH